ncbi:MAG: hypothetical protein NC203_07795 [Firmicutes bacterium]|nr:hypothetical protein [[Eubacterium] siraeum]MCM1488252.1 hypothetical protein [Bacillota bacterium]
MGDEQAMNIFKNEIVKELSSKGYETAVEDDWIAVISDGEAVAKINDRDIVYTDGDFYDKNQCEKSSLSNIVRNLYEVCDAYEKASPLIADGLSDNYRCLSEFNGSVLAAKYSEHYGFEFVTWDKTYDGKSLWQGHYYGEYSKAKADFAVRSGLVDEDKLFDEKELIKFHQCLEFTLNNDESLDFEQEKALTELKEKIEESVPCQTENQEQEFGNLSM